MKPRVKWLPKSDLTRVRVWLRLARECKYNAAELARQCHLSSRQLCRYCQQRFGMSPQEWLDEQRIITARYLLREKNGVKTVAHVLGFKQSSHFCRQFKFYHGLTPSQFVAVT